MCPYLLEVGALDSFLELASRMAHSRVISVLYLLEPVGQLILELLQSSTHCSLEVLVSFNVPLPAGASRMTHSTDFGVLYMLESLGQLILELLVSSTCWGQ